MNLGRFNRQLGSMIDPAVKQIAVRETQGLVGCNMANLFAGKKCNIATDFSNADPLHFLFKHIASMAV